MKKIIAFILAAVLLLCAVSCGEAEKTPTDTVETTSAPDEEKIVISELADIKDLVSTDKEPTEYTVGEDRYDLDCYAFRFDDTEQSDFEKAVSSLTDNGFTLYATNGDGGINGLCYQATLYNSAFTVNVTRYAKTKDIYVTVEAYRALSPLQIKPTTQVLGTHTVYHNPKHPNDAKGNYAFGECDIFQLSNNHFVIVDGAQEYSAQMLVEYLEAIVGEGNTPIVDAWFFTHAHPDHIYCAWGIGRDEDLVSRIRVNGFYYTWPNDAGMRRESDYEKGILIQVGNFNNVIGNFRDEDGNVTPRYKLHGGMVFYIDEMKVEILITQDQLMPSEYQGGFNDSSTSYKFTVYSQSGEVTTFLIMGDAHRGVCTKLIEKYDYETLHTTFFTSLHHGGNDITEFFKFIKPDYLIYTSPSKRTSSGYSWLNATCKGVFVAGDVIELPYSGDGTQEIGLIDTLKGLLGW